MSDGLRWDQGPAAAARDARASPAPIPHWGELDDERDDNVAYEGLGGDYFARRADPERLAKRLVAQLDLARQQRHATNVNGRRRSRSLARPTSGLACLGPRLT